MSGVMARCPRCKGWTMFHADKDSDTGREWTAQCIKAGDTIEELVDGDDHQAQLGHSCKDAYMTSAPGRRCIATHSEES